MADISELASKEFYHTLMLSSCNSTELRLSHHLDGVCLAACVLTCLAVPDLPTRVTLIIFLGGVCSTQRGLCTALLFFLGDKPPLYVLLFIASTFSSLLYLFFCETYFFKCVSDFTGA